MLQQLYAADATCGHSKDADELLGIAPAPDTRFRAGGWHAVAPYVQRAASRSQPPVAG